MKRSILVLAVVLAGYVAPSFAEEPQAEAPPCAGRHEVVDALKSRYSEKTAGVGLTAQGAMIELLTSEDGSWSLLLNFPDGRACMMAAGNSWEGLTPKIPGRDS